MTDHEALIAKGRFLAERVENAYSCGEGGEWIREPDGALLHRFVDALVGSTRPPHRPH